jgi:hypothetical protein
MSAPLVGTPGTEPPLSFDDIPGWFDFQEIYSRAVRDAPDDGSAHFVEVGAAYGKSAAYMAWQIRMSGKRIRFDAIDTWEQMYGSPEDLEYGRRFGGGSAKGAFMYSLRVRGLDGFVRPLQMHSVAAASQYADNSLDFVFIDGDHTLAGVTADIAAYFPKVKAGGILAGHDYHAAEYQVKEAVNEYFKWRTFTAEGSCWWHRKIFRGKSLWGEEL